jgi:Domain of unknown function (DUF4129)
VLACAAMACAFTVGAQARSVHGSPSAAAAQHSTSVPRPTPAQEAEFARAGAAAKKILGSAEFQRPEPGLWDRIKAKIIDTIIRIFDGIDRVTTKSPWMGRTLEWILFLAAAAGLLVWVMRTVQRQRLRVALGGEPAKNTAWARETEAWWTQAEREAAKGAWREAIHAVYWAAIVHLERRRAWRHDPARTPREYVRLLKTGSAEQRELRGLTNALEQNWYGQREASEENFGEARASFERLADGSERPESVVGGKA